MTASKSTATPRVAKAKPAASTAKAIVKKDASWYDYPEYYDAGFNTELWREADFFEKAFAKYVPFPVKRVFEPGCGSGRLIIEMAKRGYDMTGLDLSDAMLGFCRDELKEKGLKARLIRGDMTDFRLTKPVDAAFNPINTFRHLLTEDAARQHLQCVTDALKPGGIYILGLHLCPRGCDYYGTERWQVKYGDAKIYYALTVVDSDLKTRVERLRLTMTVKKPDEQFKLIDHLELRLYNAKQLKELIASVPELSIREVFDFWYDIEEPQKLNTTICDTVLVLQKAAE